ncbi:hypothetical protein QD460_07640 [Rhizobium jaguaris]|uniref:hypothetical protein n=1 Tax=Rhizobium jaguaris TaxID=1312183 RepID=UPI0039BFEE93
MTGIYARRAISLNAGTLEFLAYSSNRLAGHDDAAMIAVKQQLAPENEDVVRS